MLLRHIICTVLTQNKNTGDLHRFPQNLGEHNERFGNLSVFDGQDHTDDIPRKKRQRKKTPNTNAIAPITYENAFELKSVFLFLNPLNVIRHQ